MKRTPLRKASKKYAKELRTYASLKRYILGQHYFCEYPSTDGAPTCLNRAVEIHHIKGRGKMLNVVAHWLPICWHHHRYIHDHAREAREKGLLK